MQLGYFTMPLHPPGRDLPGDARRGSRGDPARRRLGFAEAFVGEHVTDLAESVTDCCVFLASLATATEQITLGTGTVNLPNGHPAAIATKIAMLDTLLEGRFVFGISPGGLPSDWEVFGNLELDRREKFLECIDHVLGIWTGEAPYDLVGKHWSISTARTMIPEIGQGAMVRRSSSRIRRSSSRSSSRARRARQRPRAAAGASSRPTSCCPAGCGRTGRRYARRRARARCRSVDVAGGEDGARRRRRAHRARVRLRAATARTATTTHSSASSSIRAGRANLFKDDPELPDSAVTTDSIVDAARDRRHRRPGRRGAPCLSRRGRRLRDALYCGIDWVDPGIAPPLDGADGEEVMPR